MVKTFLQYTDLYQFFFLVMFHILRNNMLYLSSFLLSPKECGFLLLLTTASLLMVIICIKYLDLFFCKKCSIVVCPVLYVLLWDLGLCPSWQVGRGGTFIYFMNCYLDHYVYQSPPMSICGMGPHKSFPHF